MALLLTLLHTLVNHPIIVLDLPPYPSWRSGPAVAHLLILLLALVVLALIILTLVVLTLKKVNTHGIAEWVTAVTYMTY